MSYDYLFFRVKPTVRAAADITEENTEPIGTTEEIKAALIAVFPKAVWSDSDGWLDPETFMGQVSLFDKTPQHRCFSASRINVPEVKLICHALGVVAFDGQQMLLIWP